MASRKLTDTVEFAILSTQTWSPVMRCAKSASLQVQIKAESGNVWCSFILGFEIKMILKRFSNNSNSILFLFFSEAHLKHVIYHHICGLLFCSLPQCGTNFREIKRFDRSLLQISCWNIQSFPPTSQLQQNLE